MVHDLTPPALLPVVCIQYHYYYYCLSFFFLFSSSFLTFFIFFQFSILFIFKVHLLRLDQRWMMFAPPPKHSEYFQIIGETKKNTEIVLFSDEVFFVLLGFSFLFFNFCIFLQKNLDYQFPFLQEPTFPQEGLLSFFPSFLLFFPSFLSFFLSFNFSFFVRGLVWDPISFTSIQ